MEPLRVEAVRCYNLAFEVWEAGEDKANAIELAATSLQLYRQFGTRKNLAIGSWLYSRTLIAAGALDAGLDMAQQAMEHTEAVTDPADWLVASAQEGLARALKANNSPDAPAAIAEAQRLVAAIADPDDRHLIAGQLADLL